jgi:hypothetical protein
MLDRGHSIGSIVESGSDFFDQQVSPSVPILRRGENLCQRQHTNTIKVIFLELLSGKKNFKGDNYFLEDGRKCKQSANHSFRRRLE